MKWLFEEATGEDLAACFALRFSADTLDISSWADTAVGSESQPFCGHFDGAGYKLKLRVDGGKSAESGGAGLFPAASGAVVRDLKLEAAHVRTETGVSAPLGGAFTACTVENVEVVHAVTPLGVSVTGETDLVDTYRSAGLLAYNGAGSTIRDCSVTDAVTGANISYNRYGGVAMENAGTIRNCSYVLQAPPDGASVGVNRSGGIACLNSGRIENCTVSFPAGVMPGRFFGGVAFSTGRGGGEIVDCHSDFRLTVVNPDRMDNYLGGIAGELVWGGAIRGCTVSGGVMLGNAYVGGVAGQVSPAAGTVCTVSDCEVSLLSVGSGERTGISYLGGLIGYVSDCAEVLVENCVSYASVYSAHYSGGLIGYVQYFEDASAPPTPAAPLLFTMRDCHMRGDLMYAHAVYEDGTRKAQAYRVGGAIGSIYGWRDGDAAYSTLITGCTSSAKVDAGDWAGGFLGDHSAKEVAAKPKGRENTVEYCHAYGDVDVTRGQNGDGNSEMIVGGFLGLGHNSSMNLVVNGCTASGDVISGLSLAGGFLGGDAWRDQNTANTAPNNRYVNCSATGNVKSWQWAGGFAGWLASYGVQVENCSATGDVECTGAYAGGFAARIVLSASVRNCTAAGNAKAADIAAGFIAYAENTAAGEVISFEYCTATGGALRTGTAPATQGATKGTGGFVGRMAIVGTVQFRYCTAAGNAVGDSVGGFMGYSFGTGVASFYRCEAYGDAVSQTDGEAGGFLGWPRTATLVMDGCVSYGRAQNTTNGSNNDAAGFISALESKATITDCASYAPAVAGYPDKIASFLVMYQAGSAGTKLTNCTYTVCKAVSGADLPMIVYWGAAADSLAGNTGARAVAQADRPAAPGSTFRCAVTSAAKTLSISVSGVAQATSGTLTELSVSLDGGKSFTQLVYNGTALTALGAIPAGGAVGNIDLSLTYTAIEDFALADVRVYLVYSDGFIRMCRAA